ncbi:class I SAM-dependent DNA methyltransferase [Oceanobacillus kapialis]|uniref:class I SAM-dependent DNA methyltransferase n=1 Tax=Oceanobacillus kapialis TaxID=481353 RepID=UPI00384E2B79
MEYKGSAAYDNDTFYTSYMARRHRKESPNNVMEYPVLRQFIGDVKGMKILDLGCGEGLFGLDLLEAGCTRYEAVEGSRNMVNIARDQLAEREAAIHHSVIEEWNFPQQAFDLITSRLVFHYLKDLSPIFDNIYQALHPNGRLIFSVQHPVLTASRNRNSGNEKRSSWNVDNYFESGERVEQWMNKDVVKYHRTIEEYFHLLTRAGFHIKNISECPPERVNFSTEEEFARRERIPLFLLFSCEK